MLLMMMIALRSVYNNEVRLVLHELRVRSSICPAAPPNNRNAVSRERRGALLNDFTTYHGGHHQDSRLLGSNTWTGRHAGERMTLSRIATPCEKVVNYERLYAVHCSVLSARRTSRADGICG
jgi:hypothetical protein